MNNKRITACVMAGTLLFSGLFIVDSFAMEKPSQKEEVIYINLDGNGKKETVYAVNSFTDSTVIDYGTYDEMKNMNTTDKITYENGRIAINNSSEKLYYEGIMPVETEIPWEIAVQYFLDQVPFSAQEMAGKSGNLEIHISIKKNTKAREGFFNQYALQAAVKLDTTLARNIKTDGATEANVGSIKQLTYTILPGTEKEIVITTDVTDFEMDGISFNGIKLNLGINGETIDTSTLDGKLSEVMDAISKIDNGANDAVTAVGKLSDGSGKLNDGILSVKDALTSLNGQSPKVTKGSREIKSALTTIQSALSNLSVSTEELKKLSDASVQIKQGIGQLVEGLKTADTSIQSYYSALASAGMPDINDFIEAQKEVLALMQPTKTQRALYEAYLSGKDDGLKAKLSELATAGDKEATALYKEAASGNETAIQTYLTETGKQISLETLIKEDISYIQGSEALISGLGSVLDQKTGSITAEAIKLQNNYKTFHKSVLNTTDVLGNMLSDMAKLKSGIDSLTKNYNTFDQGLTEYTSAVSEIEKGYQEIVKGSSSLLTGMSELYDGTKDLANGTGELSEETGGMNNEVEENINSMLKELEGGEIQTQSFVSEQNTNVEFVQFVIKSADIKKEKVEQVIEVQEENVGFWNKLLRLFGIN